MSTNVQAEIDHFLDHYSAGGDGEGAFMSEMQISLDIVVRAVREQEQAAKDSAVQEARTHKMEADTAKASLAECYKAARAEHLPDWNGPKPVADRIEELEKDRRMLLRRLDARNGIARPFPGCIHADADDGTCQHPQAISCECHPDGPCAEKTKGYGLG